MMSVKSIHKLFVCLIVLGYLSACGLSSQNSEAGSTPLLAKDTIPETSWDSVATTYLLGKFNQANDSMFVRLRNEHSAGAARGAYLRKEAYQAFIRMHEAAKADGISLIILSATRNFYYQKGIWERKWKGQVKVSGKNLAREVKDPVARARMILRYSSMPGTSRHHWGTDIDLNAFVNRYFESGQGLKEYEWLKTHAHEFGFCQPYTAKGPERPYGYEEEKWHWSYLPLSLNYLQAYKHLIRTDSIHGFMGAEVADSLELIQQYVFGVSPRCQ